MLIIININAHYGIVVNYKIIEWLLNEIIKTILILILLKWKLIEFYYLYAN